MDQAAPQVDFYARLLDIPAGRRPPNHYELLGVPLFTPDFAAIETAVQRRMEHLDQFALHPDSVIRKCTQEMLTEVAQARVCLAEPAARQKYDQELAAALGLNMATVDLPVASPVHRRPVLLVALAVCAVLIIGGAIATVIFLSNKVSSPSQPPGGGNVSIKPSPNNQAGGVVSQKEIDDTFARVRELRDQKHFQQAIDLLGQLAAKQPDPRLNEAIENIMLAQRNADLSLTAKSDALCQSGQYREAIALLRDAITIDASPCLQSELTKVQAAKEQIDKVEDSAATKVMTQVEALLGDMPQDPTALSPAQREGLKQCSNRSPPCRGQTVRWRPCGARSTRTWPCPRASRRRNWCSIWAAASR